MTVEPWGFQWRSSKPFIIACITVALFSDTFLYGFIVPILSYMLEDRLHVDPSQTQSLTSAILAIHGVVAIVTAPIVGHFADQSPSRKLPLLFSLAACIVGTVLVACALSLWLLFLGRVLQGIAGSAVWIVALATVADTVGEEHMGKVMGLVDSFVTAGIIAGPVVSGLFLQVWGYWGTWAAPLVVLTLDIIARLVMIENPEKPKPSSTSSSGDDESASSSSSAANPDENRALLADDDAPNSTMYQSTSTAILDQSKKQDDLSTSLAFYRAMLTNSRAMTALLISIASSSVMTSFDATIPLHVRDMFGWGPSTTSMMFLSLEAPTILTGPLSGWLRDQFGIRIPATLSLVVLAPLMWLLGVPGDEHFPWASADTGGLPIYISSLICIGAVAPFLSGVGILELTAVVKEHMAQNPNIFGPNGGYSRAYAMVDVASAIAMTLGPIVSGSLRQTIGYYYMNVVFAIVFLMLSVSSFCFLGGRNGKQEVPTPE